MGLFFCARKIPLDFAQETYYCTGTQTIGGIMDFTQDADYLDIDKWLSEYELQEDDYETL